jgi:anthranilate phosphoribosyltransferase
VLGAALALEVTGAEPNARSAVARARRVLASGAGTRLLDRITAFAKERGA